MRLGIKCASNWLHVCPFRVCDVGYATANQQSCFNKLTNCSVWFNSHSYASLSCETTSVFTHFKSPCWGERLKASSLLINRTPNFPGRINFLCIVQRRAPRMWSVAPASWDFSAAHGRMCDIEWRVTSTKKSDNMLKISHFYGLWDVVFTTFGYN